MLNRKTANRNYSAAFALCALLLSAVISHGQNSIHLLPQSPSGYSLFDLSQTSLINGTPGIQTMCYTIIECEKDGSGISFTLKTPSTDLIPGSNILGYQSLVNAEPLATSPDYFSFTQTGRLPEGKYNLCITLYQALHSTPLARQCISLQVAATGYLILMSPYDKEVLNTFYPNFFWSFNLTPGDFKVTYAIKVSELKAGQTYMDAISFNPPLVYEENLEQTVFNYPSSAFSLNEDGRYVWQVAVYINGKQKYLSEIWMFQYKKNKEKTTKKPKKELPDQFPHLQRTVASSAYVFDKYIAFRYNNECRDTLLSFAVYKTGEQKSLPLDNPPIRITSGINYIYFPVAKSMKGKNKGKDLYLFEVSNSRKEKWRMKFIISDKKEKKK